MKNIFDISSTIARDQNQEYPQTQNKWLDNFETRKSSFLWLMMMRNLMIFSFFEITINNPYQFDWLELEQKGHHFVQN